jgi:hypothetical protein
LVVDARDLERGYSARPPQCAPSGRAGSRRAARILGEVHAVKGRGDLGISPPPTPLSRRARPGLRRNALAASPKNQRP